MIERTTGGRRFGKVKILPGKERSMRLAFKRMSPAYKGIRQDAGTLDKPDTPTLPYLR